VSATIEVRRLEGSLICSAHTRPGLTQAFLPAIYYRVLAPGRHRRPAEVDEYWRWQ
jgi:hypothetical protein